MQPTRDLLNELQQLRGQPRVTFENGDPAYPVTQRTMRFPIGQEPAYASAEPDAVRFPSNVLVEKYALQNDGHFVDVYLKYQRVPGKITTLDQYDDEMQVKLFEDHYLDFTGASKPAIGDTYRTSYTVDDSRDNPLGDSTLSQIVIAYSALPANRIDYIEDSVTYPGHFIPVRDSATSYIDRNSDGDVVEVDLDLSDGVILLPINTSGVSGLSWDQVLIRPGVNVDYMTPRQRRVICRRTRIFAVNRELLAKAAPKPLRVFAPASGSSVLRRIDENTIHPAFKVYAVDMQSVAHNRFLLEQFGASSPASYDPTEVITLGANVRHWRGNKYFLEILESSETGNIFINDTAKPRTVKLPFQVPALNSVLRDLDALSDDSGGHRLWAYSTHSLDDGYRVRIVGRVIGAGDTVNPIGAENVTLNGANVAQRFDSNWFRLYGVQLVESATTTPVVATGTIRVVLGGVGTSPTESFTITALAGGAAGDTFTLTRATAAGGSETKTYTWGSCEVSTLTVGGNAATFQTAAGGGHHVDQFYLTKVDGSRHCVVVYRSDTGALTDYLATRDEVATTETDVAITATQSTAALVATQIYTVCAADPNVTANFTVTNPSAGVLVFTNKLIGNAANATEYIANVAHVLSITAGVGTAGANTILWNTAAATKATVLAAVLSNPTTAIAAFYANPGSTTLAAITGTTVTVDTPTSTTVTLGEALDADDFADYTGTTQTGTSLSIGTLPLLSAGGGTVVATIAAGSSSAYPAISLDNPAYDQTLIPRLEVISDSIPVGVDSGAFGSAVWKLFVGQKRYSSANGPLRFSYQVSHDGTNWVDGADGTFYLSSVNATGAAAKLFQPSDYASHTYLGNSVTTKYVRIKLDATTDTAPAAVYAYVEQQI